MADSEQALSHPHPKLFPKFAQLPPELRNQIWKEAIYEYPACRRIFYYTLYNVDKDGKRHSRLQDCPGVIVKPDAATETQPEDEIEQPWYLERKVQTTTSIQRLPSNTTWAQANRFRNFYDGGLRTACVGSREAYTRYKQRRSAGESLTIARAHDGNNDELQIDVRPDMDLLCLSFSPEDLEAAAAGLQWNTLIASIPFWGSKTIETVNLAFEFAPSWNEGLPDDFDPELRKEASPRGLCAGALWAWAHGELPASTRVYLIDRSWKPPKEYFDFWGKTRDVMHSEEVEEQRPAFFTDGKKPFVETKLWWDETPEFDASAAAFVWRLKGWHQEYRKTQWMRNEVFGQYYRMLPDSLDPFCVTALRCMVKWKGPWW